MQQLGFRQRLDDTVYMLFICFFLFSVKCKKLPIEEWMLFANLELKARHNGFRTIKSAYQYDSAPMAHRRRWNGNFIEVDRIDADRRRRMVKSADISADSRPTYYATAPGQARPVLAERGVDISASSSTSTTGDDWWSRNRRGSEPAGENLGFQKGKCNCTPR